MTIPNADENLHREDVGQNAPDQEKNRSDDFGKQTGFCVIHNY